MPDWKHVLPALERDGTFTLYTTRWGAAPVGPRLQKGLAMPSLPYSGLKTAAEAISSADAFDDWLEKQAAGERDTHKKKAAIDDHYGKTSAPAAPPPPPVEEKKPEQKKSSTPAAARRREPASSLLFPE